MDFLVVGAGKIGTTCVKDLAQREEIDGITVVDNRQNPLVEIADIEPCKTALVDVTDVGAIRDHFAAVDCAIGATKPEHYIELTNLAIETGTHWVDLGGEVTVLRDQIGRDEHAIEAGVTAVPGIGLAPGLVNMLAVQSADKFDKVDEISIRVGGLPQNPELPLGYALLFSVAGLIAEYAEPVEIIESGERTHVSALDGYETISFPELGKVEAFFTAGALGTMPERFEGQVDRLTYKSIRYPGHREKIAFLRELGLFDTEEINIAGKSIAPRDMIVALLTEVLPSEVPDLVAAKIEVTGTINDTRERMRTELYGENAPNFGLSAMERTSSYPATVAAILAAKGNLEPGVYPPEGGVPITPIVDYLEAEDIIIRRNRV